MEISTDKISLKQRHKKCSCQVGSTRLLVPMATQMGLEGGGRGEREGLFSMGIYQARGREGSGALISCLSTVWLGREMVRLSHYSQR